MDLNSYFGSLLKNSFSFLQAAKGQPVPPADVSGEFISNSDQVLIETADSSSSSFQTQITSKGDENTVIQLMNSLNVSIKTGHGNDVIELTPQAKTAALSTNEIWAGNGNNVVSINTLAAPNAHYMITTGTGNDWIMSTGYSNDHIKAGAGRDVIMSGKGLDHIDGEEGWDKVLFEGALDEYNIDVSNPQSTQVSSKEDSAHQAELVNVEELLFADQGILLPYQELVQLDGAEFAFNYLDNDGYSADSWSYDTADSWTYTITDSWSYFDLADQASFSYITSVTIEDWSEQEDTADTLIASLENYQDSQSTAGFENIPDIGGRWHDMFGDILPFNPFEVLHNQRPDIDHPLKILGGREDDLMMGGDFNDFLLGGAGDDLMMGGHGNDMFIGDRGNDMMLGGDGIDSAFFLGMSKDFTFDIENGIMTDRLGEHGIDFLQSIEKLIFLDAVYKITADNRIELIDENPFELMESYSAPHLEIIGLPPRDKPPEIDAIADVDDLPPPLSAAEIEEHMMRAYETVTNHLDNMSGPNIEV